jgi:hypothetical protein
VEQNARLYALAATVLADADAAMVDGKLTYSFWRPLTAIRNGDQDGNPATQRDANWEPLLKTPLHPEYPCGHCVIISALTTVLATEGPPPPGGIAVTSDAMPGVVHYVDSYAQLSSEISLTTRRGDEVPHDHTLDEIRAAALGLEASRPRPRNGSRRGRAASIEERIRHHGPVCDRYRGLASSG